LKTRLFSLSVFCVVILWLIAVFPATIASPSSSSSDYGWASLAAPVIDGEDDVLNYSVSQTPSQGTFGDFHNEIDILNISVLSSDLVIMFASTPGGDYTEYSYTILIDNDTDGTAEYCIYSGNIIFCEKTLKIDVIDFYLKRVSDGYHYNPGIGWVSSATPFGWGIYTQKLQLFDIDHPIPEINSSRIAMWILYTGQAGIIYADYAPFSTPGGGGVPGFPLALALFGLLTLLGFAVILHKQHLRL
jgi:hypothetical protein